MEKILTPQNKLGSLDIGEVLKRTRKERKISQQELAERLGVSKKTIVNWESDRNKPDLDTIPLICGVIGISPAELLGIPTTYDSTAPEEAALIASFRKLSASSRRMLLRVAQTAADEEDRERAAKLAEDFGLFLVHPGKAAAGAGEELFDPEPSYCFLKKNDMNEKADGIIRVKGHSMEPDYPNGCSLYYKKAETAKPGDDVLVSTGDGYVVKRLNNKNQLYSVNPALPYTVAYEDMYMKIEGVILGQVASADRPTKDEREALEVVMEEKVREFRINNGIAD